MNNLKNPLYLASIYHQYLEEIAQKENQDDNEGGNVEENTPPAPDKLTKRQAAIIGAFTGYTAGPFSDIHEYVEELLGRPVFTHEMASPKFAAEIKEKAKADYLSICSQ